jgi:hypothetical protein
MPNYTTTSYKLGFHEAFAFYSGFVANTTVATVAYILVGRPTAWPSGDTVPPLYDTENTQIYTYNDFLGGKRVTGNDAYLVLPRRNWTSGIVYTQYDDDSNTQFSSSNSLYVYASNGNVYKCLDNANNAPSTIEPTTNHTTDSGFCEPGDGYLWKYMYKVPSGSKFLTSDWIPVPTEQTAGYFGYANNLVAGAITRIAVRANGTGYVQNTTSVTISGSGLAGNAAVTVTGGGVASVSLSNRGSGYIRQNTKISIAGAGSGANVRTILSPYGGHGFNPAKELGANAIMLSVKVGDVDSTEGGTITANNDFRQIGLLMSPYKYGESAPLTAANANIAITMVTQAIVTSGSSYTLDEAVYQGSSYANAYFSGYVSDVYTNAIEIVGRGGTPSLGYPLVGVTSGASRTLVSYTDPELDVESGSLIYIENRAPVVRSIGQGETIKIVLNF